MLEQTDPEAIARELERVAGRSWSPSRDLEIDALLGRLSDLDPAYAADAAVALQLDAPFVATAWLAWAERDADAALDSLALVPNLLLRREIALALTDVLGDDSRNLARIAGALPPAEGDVFRIEWLAERAERDPFTAFRDAMTIPEPTLQRMALERIGIVWAAIDPYDAIAQADLLPRDAAQAYRNGVFREWARLDIEGFVSWLGSLPSGSPDTSQIAVGLQYVIAVNPELLERIADNLPPGLAGSARATALEALASSDPEAAKARAEALPPGQDREAALQAVATALAASDPDAALEWVRGLSPPAPNALRSITLAFARTEPARLFALLDDPSSGIDPQLLLVAATSIGNADPAQLPVLANGLLARDDAQSTQALQRLIGSWMQRDPENAVDWVLANQNDVDANVLESAAQTLAARDPVLAAGFVDRLPPEQRGAWITQVASQYGRYDPQAAMAWVGQFQGQPTYEVALREVIAGVAQSDARTAAQMLAQASGNVQLGAAQQVATALAQQDPRAAASWAQSLSDPRAQAAARRSVATAWYATDRAAGRRYILDIPAGAERDEVISNAVLLSVIGQQAGGDIDVALIDAYSNEQEGQQLAAAAITMLVRSDPARARTLADDLITDPELRSRIDAAIENGGR